MERREEKFVGFDYKKPRGRRTGRTRRKLKEKGVEWCMRGGGKTVRLENVR